MMVIYVILSVYGKNFITQTVLELLRYQYLHKSRNNPLCPQGDLWD